MAVWTYGRQTLTSRPLLLRIFSLRRAFHLDGGGNRKREVFLAPFGIFALVPF